MSSAMVKILPLLVQALLVVVPPHVAAQAPSSTPEGAAAPSYDAIVEKDLFRPGRKRWVAPPPPPLRPIRPATPGAPAPPPRAEPEPKFVLHGVALASDGTQIVVLEEPQFTKGKILPFHVGDRLGPYQVKEISPKGTVLEGPSKSINLVLRGEVPPQTEKGPPPETN